MSLRPLDEVLGSLDELLGPESEPAVVSPEALAAAALTQEGYRRLLQKENGQLAERLGWLYDGEADVARILEVGPNDLPVGKLGLSLIDVKLALAGQLAERFGFRVPPDSLGLHCLIQTDLPTVPVGLDIDNGLIFYTKKTVYPHGLDSDAQRSVYEMLRRQTPLVRPTDMGFESIWYSLIAARMGVEPKNMRHPNENFDFVILKKIVKYTPLYQKWYTAQAEMANV